MAESIGGTNALPLSKKTRKRPTTELPLKLDAKLPQKHNVKEKASEQEIPTESSDSSISDEDGLDYHSSESSESSESSASSKHLPGPEDGSESSEETDSSDCSDSSDNSNSSSESDIEELIKRIKSNRTHIEEFNKGILNKNSPDTTKNLPLFSHTICNPLLHKKGSLSETKKKRRSRSQMEKLAES
ncbi:dentin sialophosphoprotein [Octopus bimaculoides]|uniref:Uncharacterized protein n=1 Tax=Octopus bimaculoides TaxID=37653 RepID=A0A0L8HCR8_OCTBM|nr:dentin sialophosphoprotein [Octopus bimaculoides]|eukprot:XP_014773573.1 PREDICTED: dentin sialophosphoprotein-like [Octopus bimaculoides]